jgi:7-cyano-7-deazaguanine synthase
MTQTDASKAIVLFSGGQDSTTCLAWALRRYSYVETIGFDYAQRHSAELAVRGSIRESLGRCDPAWATRLGPDHLVPVNMLAPVAMSALLDETPLGTRDDGLPATFVPGRNIIFLTLSAIIAKQRGIKVLVTGTCETDFSGYPDCRDDTIKALQVTLNLGLECRFTIETPLMWIDKAATWQLAAELGGLGFVELIVEETHTCYLNDREHRHAWGYGCASCDACVLRSRGWDRYTADQSKAVMVS